MDTILEKQILESYLQTKSLTKTASIFGVDRTRTVRKIATKNGIEIINYHNKAKFDYRFFDTIDIENKAYWLGFLYADGNVSSGKRNLISIGLKLSDKGHLEKFRKDLNCSLLVRTDTKSGRSRCRFAICNKHTKEQLVKLGCTPRKSYTLEFPKLPHRLIHHFIRGYFDGDGCVGVYGDRKGDLKVSLLGTESFLKSVLAYSLTDSKLYLPNKNRGGDPRIKAFQCSGEKAYNFLRFIYRDSTVYLDRKYKLYQFAVQSINGLKYDCGIKQEGCDIEECFKLIQCSKCGRKHLRNEYYKGQRQCKNCVYIRNGWSYYKKHYFFLT
jgi:intein/homing endonuclease